MEVDLVRAMGVHEASHVDLPRNPIHDEGREGTSVLHRLVPLGVFNPQVHGDELATQVGLGRPLLEVVEVLGKVASCAILLVALRLVLVGEGALLQSLVVEPQMIGELPTRLEANSFAPMLTEPRSEDAFQASAIRVAH